MKGSFYGVRSKHTAIFLVALVCATILTWPLQLPYPDVVIPGAPTFISAAGAANQAEYGSSNARAEQKANPTRKHHENEDQEISLNEHFDSAAIDGGRKQSKESSDLVSSKITINTSENEACNFAKGKWVFDSSRPLYSGFGCKQWLSKARACRQTQRTSFDYEAVRWIPKECHDATEEFTGYKFLQRMRNKTLAFIGDSLGGQQFESLMCMVTGGHEMPGVVDVGEEEYNLVKVNEVGRPDGRAYRFLVTNTTILHYWSVTLCNLEQLEDDNTRSSSAPAGIAMHLDRPPAFLELYIHKFDVLVLSTWNHWNPRKFKENRWIMHVGGAPFTSNNNNILDIGSARNFTIHGVIHWVDSQIVKHPGLEAFYRSLSPRHSSKGEGDGTGGGGSCHGTVTLAHGNEVSKDGSSDSVGSEAVKGTKVKMLDITGLSQLRNEAHVGRRKGSRKLGSGLEQDCLHWCLPGVPDTWNEILFAQILL